jgi:hypothetical protein
MDRVGGYQIPRRNGDCHRLGYNYNIFKILELKHLKKKMKEITEKANKLKELESLGRYGGCCFGVE